MMEICMQCADKVRSFPKKGSSVIGFNQNVRYAQQSFLMESRCRTSKLKTFLNKSHEIISIFPSHDKPSHYSFKKELLSRTVASRNHYDIISAITSYQQSTAFTKNVPTAQLYLPFIVLFIFTRKFVDVHKSQFCTIIELQSLLLCLNVIMYCISS